MIYIVILNWNGWLDTVECLESIYRSNCKNFKIIVCDNNSSDSSTERIAGWANGEFCVYVSAENNLRYLSFPPISKPLDFKIFNRSDYESNGIYPSIEAPLTIIRNEDNLGFSGGNNVGIRVSMNQIDCSFIWLLNNDTVVEPSTLSELVERYNQHTSVNSICGSTLLYYDKNDTVQALGGASYNRWIAYAKQIGNSQIFNMKDALKNRDKIESKFYSLQGASIFFPIHFFTEIGELCEDYFLYFEEQDISAKCNKIFDLLYAPRSIVFHKEGSSIGANTLNPEEKSFLSSIFSLRSKIIFTRKFFPYALPTVYLSLFYVFFNRIRRGQKKQVPLLLKVMLDPDIDAKKLIQLCQ
jgi:GT2 family glycosyltransferase